MIRFPKDFLWGCATSAYQVEGNNINCDWWQWEKKCGRQASGRACRHYQLYEKDFDLVQKLHHNSHRLSIEWSRIEPRKGKFSRRQLQHYIEVIAALKRRGIQPIVTLHHFTNPVWFASEGGWQKRRSVKYFLRYCNFVVSALANYVDYWITINEPTVYISHAYILGVWPPQKKKFIAAAAVEENLARGHIKAFSRIHKIYERLRLPRPAVSIAQNVMAFVPLGGSLKNKLAASLRSRVYNLGFIDKIMQHRLAGRKPLDFIGVNYYSRQLVDLKKIGISNLATDVCSDSRNRCQKNSLGWDIYPKGIYHALLELKKYNLPLMITENGICTSNDAVRWKYISSHLRYIHRAMQKGVKVIGYLYWSLMDNFEWDKGFGPRFGIIGINYHNYKRMLRRSAWLYGKVCKTGVLK